MSRNNYNQDRELQKRRQTDARNRSRKVLMDALEDEKDELWADDEILGDVKDMNRVNPNKLDRRIDPHMRNDLVPRTTYYDEETIALSGKNMSDVTRKKVAQQIYNKNRDTIQRDTTYLDTKIYNKLMTPVSEQKMIKTTRQNVAKNTRELDSEVLSLEDIEATDSSFAPIRKQWKNNYKEGELATNNPIRLTRAGNNTSGGEDIYLTKLRRDDNEPDTPSFLDGDLEDLNCLVEELGLKVEQIKPKPKQVNEKTLDERRLKARDDVSKRFGVQTNH